MSITKNDNAVTLSRTALEYMAGLINKIVSAPEQLIDDVNLQTVTTFSSVRLNSLINETLQDAKDYTDEICGALVKLTCEKTTTQPTLSNSEKNVIYLYSSDGNAPFEQYLKISDTELIDMGSTSISLNDYLTITDAVATYCKKTDLNTTNNVLTTHINNSDIHVSTTDREKWNKVDNKVDKTDIVDNLTSTDTDKPLSANQGKVLKDEVDLKANGDEVVKKSDIKTTLDKNSTNDDVYGGKAIFNAIQANAIGKETALYEGRISATGTYTLTDDVNNYDFIIINHRQESGVNCQSTTLSKYEISKCSDYEHKFMCVLGYGNSEDCTTGYFNNDKLILSSYSSQTITSITGYKFGEVTVQNTITNPSPGESYSTDEQLTGGTWIDGKPIYRKVINKTFSLTGGGSWHDIGITISDIDKLIHASVIRVEDCANLNDVLFNVNSSKISALRENALSSSNFDVILEYTKKTD